MKPEKVGELYILQFEFPWPYAQGEVNDLLMYVGEEYNFHVFYCIPKDDYIKMTEKEMQYCIRKVNR